MFIMAEILTALISLILLLLIICLMLLEDENILIGEVRFIVKDNNLLTKIRKELGLKVIYEGCFVYSINCTKQVMHLKFVTNSESHVEMLHAFETGRKIRVYYKKRFFRKNYVYKTA